MKQNKQAGFTLVELSIVLIIIGLIVGGVLAGQSLIRSARLQNDIAKYNQIDSSFNGFNLRYSGLPGDASNAASFFTGTSQPTQVTNGNGDGVVAAAASTNFIGTEIASVYDHLAAAGMVALGQYDETANASNAINIGILPSRTSGGIIVYGGNGQNFIRFGIVSNAAAAGINFSNAFTPEQVSFIDNRLDDGVATSGLVTSAGTTDTSTAGDTTATTGCNSAAGVYTLGNTATACSFRIRLSS